MREPSNMFSGDLDFSFGASLERRIYRLRELAEFLRPSTLASHSLAPRSCLSRSQMPFFVRPNEPPPTMDHHRL